MQISSTTNGSGNVDVGAAAGDHGAQVVATGNEVVTKVVARDSTHSTMKTHD